MNMGSSVDEIRSSGENMGLARMDIRTSGENIRGCKDWRGILGQMARC